MDYDFVIDIAHIKDNKELLKVLKETLSLTQKQLEETLDKKISISKDVNVLTDNRDNLLKELSDLEAKTLNLSNEIKGQEDTLKILQNDVIKNEGLVDEINKRKEDIQKKKAEQTRLENIIGPLTTEKDHLENMISGHTLKLKALKEDVYLIEARENDIEKKKQEIEYIKNQNDSILTKTERKNKEMEELVKKNAKQIEYLEFTIKPISFYIRGLQTALDKQSIKLNIIEELRKIKNRYYSMEITKKRKLCSFLMILILLRLSTRNL